MNIILLSGGSGKRLWPLSNNIRSKQFLKLFHKDDGTYESMIQRVWKQIMKVSPDAEIVVATSQMQVSELKNQIGNHVNLSIEPSRRDTFPAIALAAEFFYSIVGLSKSEPIIVCPVDSYANEEYFMYLNKLTELSSVDSSKLILLGIVPTYPSEKYGYIIPESTSLLSNVSYFKEKPNAKDAEQYIEKGALWNAGIFAFQLGYILDKTHKLVEYDGYNDLLSKFDQLPNTSFDYAIVEKESNTQVVRFDGEWKDIGTWNTLTETMTENIIGNGIISDTCSNIHIVNELDIPIFAMGLDNVIISASPDGVLVSNKVQSSFIKPYVDRIEYEIMYAEKSWGEYQVINVGADSLTVRVNLNAGHSMHYHSHQYRDESWVVIFGTGRVIVDDIEKSVTVGDVVLIKRGCKHTITADTDLQLIEVQVGDNISSEDKIIY